MATLLIIVQMVAIIVGLVAAVGLSFYALWWFSLFVVQFFPVIGRRNRHERWDEFTRRSGRK